MIYYKIFLMCKVTTYSNYFSMKLYENNWLKFTKKLRYYYLVLKLTTYNICVYYLNPLYFEELFSSKCYKILK